MKISLPRPLTLYNSEASPFHLDLRAIGLFRVLLALVILLDQFIRLSDWRAFHSTSGVVSLADSRTWDNPWLWSLYWLSDAPLLPYLLEIIRFIATLTLLFGIRSRLSSFVLFVLLASVAARTPLILQGGDKVLIAMTFFATFLPLGERGSLASLWFGERPKPFCRSAASAAYAIQVLLVFFMAGILKTGEQWWGSGTAISMAIHLEAFATEFSRLWRSWDWLSRPMTHFVFVLECMAPLLALVPNYWCRLIGLFALVALEVGIWLSLEVGLFPLISLISLVPLFPGRLIDFGMRMRRGRSQESDLVLFYDRDCRFCAFACRLLLAVCGLRGARMREAQSNPIASSILDESFAWSVTRIRRPERGGAEGDLDPNFRQGWEAVRLLVQSSPRSWLLRVLPGDALGDRLYEWIGRNRGAIGRLGGACFGRNKSSVWQGPIGQSVASFALVVVLAWNVVTYPGVREWSDLRPYVAPVISLLNLQQYWDMFAPYPYASDYWHVMPALARDGSRVDLLSSTHIVLEPPVDGPDHYGGYRWRKTIFRSLQRGQIDRVFRYYCLTGHWAALDLWEFSRPNLGNAATAEQPYGTTLMGRWQCDAVDMSAVDGFRSDIDSMMREYGGG